MTSYNVRVEDNPPGKLSLMQRALSELDTVQPKDEMLLLMFVDKRGYQPMAFRFRSVDETKECAAAIVSARTARLETLGRV